MQNKLWWSIIIGGWMTVAAASSVLDLRRDLAPASDWLKVEKLHVYDAWQGEAPYMHVKRTIKAPFFAEWTATVRKASDGTMAFACLADGR